MLPLVREMELPAAATGDIGEVGTRKPPEAAAVAAPRVSYGEPASSWPSRRMVRLRLGGALKERRGEGGPDSTCWGECLPRGVFAVGVGEVL